MSSPSAFESLFGGLTDVGSDFGQTLSGGKKCPRGSKKDHRKGHKGECRRNSASRRNKAGRRSTEMRNSGMIFDYRKGHGMGALRSSRSVRKSGKKCRKGFKKDTRKFHKDGSPVKPGSCRRVAHGYSNSSIKRKYTSSAKSGAALAMARMRAHERLREIRESYNTRGMSPSRSRAREEVAEMLAEAPRPKRKRRNEAELLAGSELVM